MYSQPMANALSDEKYLSFTTFRKDGRGVSSPVWNVDLGGDRLGFWTSSGSGKVKRLAHTERVTLQPCDGRGKVRPGTSLLDATAHVVTGPELDTIRAKVRAKYGVMTKVTKVLALVAGVVRRKRIPYGDRGVVVVLGPTGQG